MKPAFGVLDSGLHQQPRNAVLHLHHLLHQQMPIAQSAAAIADLARHHVALGQEIAAQAVSDFSSVNGVVLLLRRSDGPQHQPMGHLDLNRVRQQMVIDPPAEDGGLHGHRPGLGQARHPAVQFPPGGTDLALLLHSATGVLYAVADRLLVYVQSDVIHIVSEEPPWLFSESASPLSSAYATPTRSSLT